jgi:hypothetical protein
VRAVAADIGRRSALAMAIAIVHRRPRDVPVDSRSEGLEFLDGAGEVV